MQAVAARLRPMPVLQQLPYARRRRSSPLLHARRRPLPARAFLGDMTEPDFDGLSALGLSSEVVVLASVFFSTLSLAINYYSGISQEKKRAELQMELDREKAQQARLAEVRSVISRYRGPLLESAIDLEQPLFHLVTDNICGNANECPEHIRYLLFTLAQFLGFLEVLRREGPRERTFLQAGNPHGSDTLQTLVEGVRFVLCSSQSSLEKWYAEGPSRPHPGNRTRKQREAIVAECQAAAAAQAAAFEAPSGTDRMQVSRGMQRAIGSLMITTAMGAERHYTLSYSDFYDRLDSDPAFSRWFEQLEADAFDLASGAPWQGERPFVNGKAGRWTRCLLLQQLLVEAIDLLDPACARLPLERRRRLMPVKWGPLPNIELYTAQLQELFGFAGDLNKPLEESPLVGLRHLFAAAFESIEEGDFAAAAATASQGRAAARPSSQQQQQQQQQQQPAGQLGGKDSSSGTQGVQHAAATSTVPDRG